MNKSILSVLVTTALGLTGCGSSSGSDSSTPDVESRLINVSTALTYVSEVNALSQECLPVGEYPLNYDENTYNFENPVCKIRDDKGNIHFIRTNDYQMTVVDSAGVVFTESINDITNFNFSFEVTGEANINVDFIGELDGQYDNTYSYYTVETPRGGQEVGRQETDIIINVDNEDFSFVTFQSNNDDILLAETTITTDEIYHYGVTLNLDDVGNTKIAYRYIKQDAELLFTARSGDTATSSINFKAKEHYDFGVLAIDPNDGSIIITPPDFGVPIVIIPTPANAVITPSQVIGAEVVSYEKETGAATYGATKKEPSIFPELKIEKNKYTLGQMSFSYDVSTTLEKASTYMNIYLVDSVDEDGNDIIHNAVLYPDNTVNVMQKIDGSYKTVGSFENKEDFISAYKDKYLDTRMDSGRVQTNFIIRVSDANTTPEFNFTVNEYQVDVTPLTPTLPLDQVVDAQDVVINEDNSVSGNIGYKDAFAYFPMDHTFKLSKVTSVEIEAINAKGWWNVYLESDELYKEGEERTMQYRINWETITNQFSVAERDYAAEDAKRIPGGAEWKDTGDYSLYTWEDVLNSRYAEMDLQTWVEGGVKGNFFLRLGETVNEEMDFTIKKYSIVTE